MPSPIFATTHWSEVLQASHGDSPLARKALEDLCRTYWFPLYAYARGLGQDQQSAEDMTQEFFRRMLEKSYLSIADRRRGKFRWFLLTAFKCFLANEWDRARAKKRGGGQSPLSLDALSAEQRYQLEPADTTSPELIFEKRWALTLLEVARERLRAQYTTEGKADRFEQLEGSLPGEENSPTYAHIGRELGLSEPAVKAEAHRMKRRYGELLRQEVAKTVADPGEVEEEIRHLIEVMARP